MWYNDTLFSDCFHLLIHREVPMFFSDSRWLLIPHLGFVIFFSIRWCWLASSSNLHVYSSAARPLRLPGSFRLFHEFITIAQQYAKLLRSVFPYWEWQSHLEGFKDKFPISLNDVLMSHQCLLLLWTPISQQSLITSLKPMIKWSNQNVESWGYISGLLPFVYNY